MRRIIRGPKVTWVDIQDPTQADVQYLKEKFRFHPLVLEELIPPSYRPKVEHQKDYLFMILYYPVSSKERRETRPRELDIIITENTLITSHYQSILPLKALFDKCNLYKEMKIRYTSEGSGQLLFYLLSGFWKNCLSKLIVIEKQINKIEKEMFQGKEKEMVSEISLVKTDIINFWRIIEPQKEILESLANEGINFFGQDLAPYFHDILGTYGKTLNALKSYKETILALENTNQSLLSTRTNEIIKILTIFSVIILPLTLLTSIWSMNVYLPFAQSPVVFWIIIATLLNLMGLMFFYFRKKKWL